jgi:zinc D-Ala-D-Ala carboxypeptidase
MKLSAHFTKEELEASSEATEHKIDNTIPPELMPRARSLCDALERVRALLSGVYQKDVGIIITSGYRCPALNKLVGGQPTSQHLKMEAADFHTTIGTNAGVLDDTWTYIKDSDLPYDQLLLEHDSNGNTWVHYSIPEIGMRPRRLAFKLEKK